MQIVIFKPLFSFIDLHRKSLIGSKQIQFYTYTNNYLSEFKKNNNLKDIFKKKSNWLSAKSVLVYWPNFLTVPAKIIKKLLKLKVSPTCALYTHFFTLGHLLHIVYKKYSR